MVNSGRKSRAGWLLLAALLAIVLTARLGFWQLDRARQKLDLQARIESRLELPALPQALLAREATAAEAQHYRRVNLRGRWLVDRTLYLDNRQMNERQGFFVVTPLLLATGDAVLVQRGWSPRDFNDRTRLAPLDTPTGEVLVPGRIAPPPSKLFELGAAQAGSIRQNLDIKDLSIEMGMALRPLSVQQTAAAWVVDGAADGVGSADSDTLKRQWSSPTVDVGKHHGYAFQWFAMSALITGLYVWFQLLRPRLARRTDVHSL